MLIERIKLESSEYRNILEHTKRNAIRLAHNQWMLEYGGNFPRANQCGESAIRPVYFELENVNGIETWRRYFAYGWSPLIKNKRVIEDVIIGIVGWVIGGHNVTAIRERYGDKRLPTRMFEEAIIYDPPFVLLYESGVILNEETIVDVDVHSTQACQQLVCPLGFALTKPNRLYATYYSEIQQSEDEYSSIKKYIKETGQMPRRQP